MLFRALTRAIELAGKLNKGKGAVGAFRTIGNIADTATTGALLYGASQLPGSMRDEILTEGPNDPYNTNDPTAFKLSLPQQAVFGLNNLISGPFGGKQITKESLSEDYRNRNRKDILDDSTNRQLMIEAGIKSGDIGKDIYSQAQLDEFLIPKVKTARVRKNLAQKARSINIPVTSDDTVESLEQKLAASPLSAIGQYNTNQALQQERREFARRAYQDSIDQQNTNRRQELELALAKLGNESARDERSNKLALMQLQNLEQRYERDARREDRRAQQEMYTMLLEGLKNIRF